MTAPDIEGLVERLEKASGPDRRLDGEIWKAVTEKPGDVWTNAFSGGVWHRRDTDDHLAFESPPRFTESIDAALALVPDGWWINAKICKNRGADRAFCHVTLEQDADTQDRDLEDDEPFEVSASNAPSLAIALCIAAIRARAQADEDER